MTATLAYNPDQERDDKGRWSPTGDAAADALNNWGPADPAVGDIARSIPDPNQLTLFPPEVGQTPGSAPSDPSFNDFDLDALAASEAANGSWPTHDRVLEDMWAVRGFDGPPTVLPHDEFEKRVNNEDMIVVYRGIAPPKEQQTQAAAEVWAEEYRTGPAHGGFGVFGNGTYTSTDPQTADDWAGPNRALLRIALPRDLKSTTYQNLKAQASDFRYELDKVARDESASTETRDRARTQREREGVIVGDEGRLAVALGYQAVQFHGSDTDNEDYWIIHDRSAVIVEAAT